MFYVLSLFSFVPNDRIGCETPIGAMATIVPEIQRLPWLDHILLGRIVMAGKCGRRKMAGSLNGSAI